MHHQPQQTRPPAHSFTGCFITSGARELLCSQCPVSTSSSVSWWPGAGYQVTAAISPPSLPTHDCLVYHVYSTLTCTVQYTHCTQFLVSGDTGPLELGSCTTVSSRPHHIQDTGEKLPVSSTRYLYHLALISSNCCYISTVEAGISTRISTRPTCQHVSTRPGHCK